MLHGVNGVPLVYVRAVYDSFTQQCIDNCELTGQEFAEAAKYVHTIIQFLVVGEDAEIWVKDHKRSKNGRTDFLTLAVHSLEKEQYSSKR
jgi:hypothetical protein